MYRIGLSNCGKGVSEAFFAELSEKGIAAVELSEVEPGDYEKYDFSKIYNYSKKHNVDLWSFHLPFGPFEVVEISSANAELRKKTVDIMSEIIKKGSDIGIDKFVIHPSGEPIDDAEREDRKKYSRETLSILADVCEKNGSVICVEDLPRTCLGHSIDEMKFLTAEDERIKVCFDTNHITVEKPEDVILALGDKIVTLHVSDFDFVNERHWLPGEGKINWKNVMAALKQVNYNGVFMYEIGYKCPNTIVRRELTAADFVRNANELFDGKEPTVFSEPKKDLGFFG